MTLSQIKDLLKRHNAFPKKQFGQNFLHDQNAIKKILATADIKPDDIIVEIGPGVGNLTQELAKLAKNVIAIEKDRVMVKILKDTLTSALNVEISEADILKFNEAQLPKNYKIVANLPFYLAAPAIRKFLESKNPPSLMALIIQKEVAQRIVALPPQMSLLSVSVQFYADVKITSRIKKVCFWPSPKVDSAIIKIIPQKNNCQKDFVENFFKIARAGFSHPRKQLANNLAKELDIDRGEAEYLLKQCAIESTQRAETLTVEQWKMLSHSFSG